MKRLFIALIVMVAMTANAQEAGRGEHPAYSYNTERPMANGQRPMAYDIAPMDKEQAKMVIKLIKSASFDDKKLETAKVCLALRPMFAADIETIAKSFSFDDGRLKFLKYAFDYCVDKENTLRFSRLFTFRTEAEKWEKYFYDNYKSYSRPHHNHSGRY
ncbi:MAG: DUF4476 domain-containing protein [Bacteroidaceae bacterium]|nr:DUF4476 domain-containing protein [Bacteroidaceae bacterium]